MNALLFDPPLYLSFGLLIAGLVLLYTGLSRQNTGMKSAGTAALAIAVLWLAVAHFVETGAERVTRLTSAFANAIDRRDWKTFEDLLDPKVTFERYGDRAQLLAGAKATVDKINVKNISTGNFDLKSEPGGYIVSFMATADTDVAGRLPTNWRFYWVQAPNQDGYQIYRVDSLGGMVVGTESITAELVRPR